MPHSQLWRCQYGQTHNLTNHSYTDAFTARSPVQLKKYEIRSHVTKISISSGEEEEEGERHSSWGKPRYSLCRAQYSGAERGELVTRKKEKVCRDVFSRHTKNESDGARPAGTSRLQTRIQGERMGGGVSALFSLRLSKTNYTLQCCPAASSSNGKISIFILL